MAPSGPRDPSGSAEAWMYGVDPIVILAIAFYVSMAMLIETVETARDDRRRR